MGAIGDKHACRQEEGITRIQREYEQKERLIRAQKVFYAEERRHGKVFTNDLISVANAYLRDRGLGFDISNIMATWKKPSAQENAADIFFSQKIFPAFYKETIDEKELDCLVVDFLIFLTRELARSIHERLLCATTRNVRGTEPSI